MITCIGGPLDGRVVSLYGELDVFYVPELAKPHPWAWMVVGGPPEIDTHAHTYRVEGDVAYSTENDA